MNETIFLAMMFALLAFIGGTPGKAEVGKLCPTGMIAELTQIC